MSPPASRLAAAARKTRPARLLLVEDNRINQRLASLLLAHAGHSVDAVDHGLEAVEALRARDYDLVVMDMLMPVMDGLEAAQMIRALERPKSALPIIALTANVVAGAREACLAAGMNDYVVKSVNQHTFLSTLDRWLVPDRATGAPRPDAATDTPASATSPCETEPDLSPDDLETLRVNFEPEAFRVLIASYLTNAQERLDRLLACARTGDRAGVAQSAHDLVSTSGTFGLRRLAALARALEATAREDGADIAPLVEAIAPAADTAWRQLRKSYLAA